MSSKKAIVVDYGLGNLFSVRQALEHCGGEVEFAEWPEDIEHAERVILPGVGAFADGMRGLRERGLEEALKNYAASGRPLLGICLGMQMLMESSEEFGFHKGLGLISGGVAPIPTSGADGRPHKIPHIGWNSLAPAGERSWEGTILEGLAPGDAVYFVHSFTPAPAQTAHRLADSFYNGCILSAVIASGLVYGCQFHPEKSGSVGIRILKNFLNMKPALRAIR